MANPLVTSNHEVRRHFTHLPPCGSFPPPKRIAGGNRAHERQSLPIIFKLYNLTTLQLNAVSP